MYKNSSNAQRIKHLKDAYLYQKFDNEFRFNTNIEISTDIDDHLYVYEYSKEFIENNLGADLNKNLVVQSIAAEYLIYSKTDYDLQEIDIKYIENLKINFLLKQILNFSVAREI